MGNNQAAIYCRLSSEDIDKKNKDDDSVSIQNQKNLLIDYASKQGWDIYKIYSDDDYSGLDRDRPEFNKMLLDAQNKLFNIILCKMQSRFTRDMELVEKYIHGEFIRWGIRFVSVVDNCDTDNEGNKRGRQVNGLVNEWYSEDLSKSIKAVFRKKMADGQFLGPNPSYGYMKDPNDRHRLVIDDEAAEVVRTVFSLYLQGYGCQQIANKLTADSIPTPTNYKRSKGININNPHGDKYSAKHGIWANNTINKMLKNSVYIGTLIQGREKKLSFKDKKVVLAPEDEWVVIKNNHEPIVDINTFYTVQELLHNRRQVHKPKNGYTGAAKAHLLAGKVRCLDCGTSMQRSASARNGDHYLRCGLAHRTKSRECNYHSIKLELLTSVIKGRIKEMVDEYSADNNEMDILKEYCYKQDDLQKRMAKKEQELRDINKKSDEMSNAIAQAYIDRTSGMLSEDEFINIKNTINKKIQQNMNKQLILECRIDEMKNNLNNVKSADEILQQYLGFESLSHEMVNEFVDYISVGEKNEYGEQKVVVNWKF